MKKIIAIILVLGLLFIFTGCTEDKVANKDYEGSKRFTQVDEDQYSISQYVYYVYVDNKTNIVYLIGYGYDGSSGISPLLNKEGKPMTLSEYLETR